MSTRKRAPNWTPEEDAILEEVYPKGGAKAVQSHLPRRTIGAIRWRACFIGVDRAASWRSGEDKIIRKHYPNGGANACSKLMSRSLRAIYQRAFTLGVTCKKHNRTLGTRLTTDDVRLIRALDDLPQKVVAEKFGISHSSVSRIRNRKSWAHVA
jgi:hypothetical protein